MSSDYLTEFPDFGELPPQVSALVASGVLADESWHHDACPSFCLAAHARADIDAKRTLWIDYADRSQRSDPAAPRYLVKFPEEAKRDFFATDDLGEALAALLA